MSKKQGKGKKIKIQRVRLRGSASEEAALRIEELARGLRSGAIQFDGAGAAIDVPAGSELGCEIEARQGRRKSRLEIEIRWRAAETNDEDDDDDEAEEVEAEVMTEAVNEATAEMPVAEVPPPVSSPPAEEEKQELENPSW